MAILSAALAPGLIFQALALTGVNNVILVGRLEPPLTLALSVWLLKERVNIWEFLGASAAFVGGSLILVGIFLSQVGSRRQSSSIASGKVNFTPAQQQIETGMGFKGM